MKIGDLVKVSSCPATTGPCPCFFCDGKSSRVGVVIVDRLAGAGALKWTGRWRVAFDIGLWWFRPDDFESGNVKVIYEDR